MRAFRATFLLCFLLPLWKVHSEPLAYTSGVADISDGWEFGFETEPGKPPAQWKSVTQPHSWRKENAPKDRAVSGWYRFRFVQTVPDNAPLAVIPGMFDDVDETYLNGTLIGRTGRLEPREHGFDIIRVYPLPKELLLVSPDGRSVNEILCRVTNLKSGGMGGVKTSLHKLGPLQELERAVFRLDLERIGFSIVAAVVGLYFLVFFARRREEKDHLAFGVFCILLSLYFASITQLRFQFNVHFLVWKRIEYLMIFVLPFLFLSFLLSLLDLFRFRVRNIPVIMSFWILAGIVTFVESAVVLISPDYFSWVWAKKTFNEPLIFAIVLVTLPSTIILAVRGRGSARALLGGVVILLACAVNDILVNQGRYVAPYLMTYGFGGFVLSLAALLSGRFVRLHHDVEELNLNLEKKVEDRTRELSQALEQITSLKEQQDGDYFLTSLIIAPLQVDKNSSETVQTRVYLNQKKKFQFRRWASELGGDVAICGNVHLSGRRYTAFMNGDAMGKSMQGAGGAIILGVMFNAAIERTKDDRQSRYLSPEKWLFNLYWELQRTFLTFDGSMIASAAAGLVDEATGNCFFFNAEHPRLVLVRGGAAQFLPEDNQELRKLGTPGEEKRFLVRTAAIQQGDVLVLGSDGRDDLQMPAQSGIKINEDETLFLRVLERTVDRFDPALVAEDLSREGKLFDDLSFIFVSYRAGEKTRTIDPPSRTALLEAGRLLSAGETHRAIGLFEEEYQKGRPPRALAWNLAFAYKKAEKWAAAGSIYESYASEHLDALDMLYRAAVSYAKAGKLLHAVDLLERVLFREPRHSKGLALMARVQRALGSNTRAREYEARADGPGGSQPKTVF